MNSPSNTEESIGLCRILKDWLVDKGYKDIIASTDSRLGVASAKHNVTFYLDKKTRVLIWSGGKAVAAELDPASPTFFQELEKLLNE